MNGSPTRPVAIGGIAEPRPKEGKATPKFFLPRNFFVPSVVHAGTTE
jgi:hypothetical protein